jgi:O-antigen ligase
MKEKNPEIYVVIASAIVSVIPVIVFSVGYVDVDLFKICIVVALLLGILKAESRNVLTLLETRQLPILAVMVSWFLISGFWAKDIRLTFSHLFAFSLFVIFFLLVVLFTRTKNDLIKWLYCLPLTLVIAFSYDFGYVGAGSVLRQAAERVLIGTLGWAAAISILPALFIILFSTRLLPKVYGLATMVLCWLALLLSASRGGLIAVMFNITVFVFLLLRRRAGRLLKILPLIVLTLLIAVIAANDYFMDARIVFFDRLIGTFGNNFLSARIDRANYYWRENPRWELWKAAILMFKLKPVGGVGFGNFGEEVAAVSSSLYFWTFPHNVYLSVLSETGLVGLAIFLALIVTCIRDYRATSKYLVQRSSEKEQFIVRTLEITFWGLLLQAILRPVLFEFPLYFFMAGSKVSRTVFMVKYETLDSQ